MGQMHSEPEAPTQQDRQQFYIVLSVRVYDHRCLNERPPSSQRPTPENKKPPRASLPKKGGQFLPGWDPADMTLEKALTLLSLPGLLRLPSLLSLQLGLLKLLSLPGLLRRCCWACRAYRACKGS